MRDQKRRSGTGWQLTGVAIALLSGIAATMPAAADAMCCVCRSCPDAAFCVDGLASPVACAQFCVDAGCESTVYDGEDSCDGGCDGAPAEPTVTASATATATATHTAEATPTATDTATPEATPTATETATAEATATATSTAEATPTATAPPALAGAIRYYVEDRPVADVGVMLLGDVQDTTTTDASGAYAFSSAMGDVGVLPGKLGDFNDAITSLDAVYVLEAVADLRTLDADQMLAADVTADGTVSTLDAVRILELQAGLITRLPAALLCKSDWLFVPVAEPTPGQTATAPQVGDESCTPGRLDYEDLVPPLADRDFRAILLGDVTGNWQP